MRILDIDGNELTTVDESLGKLVEEEIFIAHHEAIEAVQEEGHYETIAEYPNGGKDVVWVVDVEGVQAQDAWDEYETILRYIPYTEEELAEMEAERNKPSVEDRVAILEANSINLEQLNESLVNQRAEIDENFVPQATFEASFSNQMQQLEVEYAKKFEIESVWDSIASAFAKGVQEA